MNYYRRYIADYLSKTQARSMIEDGAYTRLLDFYYANEKALPADRAALYRIARATTAPERKAVDTVLADHFEREEDGWHNGRADKELDIAVPKIDKLREVARENGRKSKGRPKKTQAGYETETQSGIENKPEPVPDLVPNRKQPPTTNHQPEAKNLSPSIATTVEEARSIGAITAALSLSEAKINPETPAGMLASVCVANSISATGFHPLVVEWAREGVTVEGLKSAIATARLHKPAPQKVPVAYLDAILQDAGKPKADTRWKTDEAECERMARKLGMWPAGARESWQELRNRIGEALHAEARGQLA